MVQLHVFACVLDFDEELLLEKLFDLPPLKAFSIRNPRLVGALWTVAWKGRGSV